VYKLLFIYDNVTSLV